MGDAQSAPEGGSDAAEEDRKVHEQFEEGQSLNNKDPIFEINVEADSFKPEVTGHREEEIDAEGRGSVEIPTDVPNDTDKEEPNRPEDVEDATKETTLENAEQYNDANVAQETYDNDSTTCPTVTDMTSEEVLENAEEKATATEAEVESNNADAAATSPLGEAANQDTTTEEEPRSASPSSPEEEAAVSPIRRFFTTGIFSGLQKKKNLGEDETTNKEMKDLGKKDVGEKTELTVQDQQHDKQDDESSFSIKKLLPRRKKRKSVEKQDQVSSDEADREAASGDEDSDTPAVVPLSEFDTVETEVHIQTQANVESHKLKEGDFELQQEQLDAMAGVLPRDNLQTEAKTVQGSDDASEYQATTTSAANEKVDDLTDSISKQQLSDIPEEATPASATDDAARDDTIAEDLIEITSEAITAAEHFDITLGDETEMISARFYLKFLLRSLTLLNSLKMKYKRLTLHIQKT
ncbi:A-kinase anchor protein 12 [Liparis tanakae]|uniref:A-kinase anchor protein 12 n=1 Tax=Liparis tanakae TaxID=230148 RepID=A0A4Z2GKD0_9TELE|nr:A-kinase anchor protein 12 [Liparis tanakae]